MSSTRAFVACAALAWSGGCGGSSPGPVLTPPIGEAGTRAWQRVASERERLVEAIQAPSPATMNLRLTIEQPLLGKRLSARGAVAVARPGALRMLLLGPGGTTALDLWVCGDSFRFAIPAIDLERRGDEATPAEELRGLPLSFLRWWLLRPLGGEMLFHHPVEREGRAATEIVARDGDETIRVVYPDLTGDHLWVERRSEHDRHVVTATGGHCGTVHYHQRSTDLRVTVVCEAVSPEPPPAKAFEDPDREGVRCPAARGVTP